ncbi:PqqD family protein [Butyrivibrio sp. AE2032]|uniref:PqqD family protein n=1 Tax=Butyrivibrio sp. AE2032 TaxID=1458463 RepID=UPI00068BA831|nr:PqqD family protein [Butyrivibrio sp. AE2032]
MYKLNEEKMFYDMADGQAVVINFETGMYYGTSSLASAVLDLLMKNADPDKVLAAIKALDGCPADIDAAFKAFIDELIAKGIVVESGSSEEVEISFDAASLADGFGLTLNEFSEVQDLLLADPIHDVDVDAGWPVMGEGDDNK